MSKRQDAQVKKVRAFPFEVELKVDPVPTPHKAQIVKMNQVGFLAEAGVTVCNVGDKMHFSFELPVLKHRIEGDGIIVKVYNHFTLASPDPQHPGTMRLLEIHFRTLTSDQFEHVTEFLRKAIKTAS